MQVEVRHVFAAHHGNPAGGSGAQETNKESDDDDRILPPRSLPCTVRTNTAPKHCSLPKERYHL
jgi:hypothetical protein